MKTKHVQFNEERALEVFTILCDLWKKKAWIFEDVVLPEDQFKKHKELANLDPVAHAHWLFIAALPQRGGVMAEDPFAPLWHLFMDHPDLFNPKAVAKDWTVERIIEAIQSVAPQVTKGAPTGEMEAGALGYKLDQHAKAWLENSKMIAERFDGNILNLFKAVHNVPKADKFEAAFKLIDNKRSGVNGIIGMRRKIFSLFIIWLQKEGLISNFPCPVPVDFHALRVLIATGVIDFPEMDIVTEDVKHMEALVGRERKRISESIINEIAIWINPFLYKHGLSHLDLNPALWVLSRELCASHPQNSSYSGNKKFLFPEDFVNGRSLDHINIRASLCSVCPIESHCDFAIPSRTYYTAGSVVKIPRVKEILSKYSVETLFGKPESIFAFIGNKNSRSKQQSVEQFTIKNYSQPVIKEEEIKHEQPNMFELLSKGAKQ